MGNVLNDLERDVITSTRDRVDWAAKKLMLSSFRRGRKLAWSDPWLQAIDLEYHNIQPRRGIVLRTAVGRVRCADLSAKRKSRTPFSHPPETTRAFFRGRAVARFNHAISSIQWDEIGFSNGKRSGGCRSSLPEPVGDERLERLNELVGADIEFEDFFREMHAVLMHRDPERQA